MKKSNYKSGHFAEKIALLFLMCHGYHLIAMNYVTGRGTGASEIDLIVQKHHTLIFVEVKKRQNLPTSAEAITTRAQNRIARAAQAFIQKHPQYRNFQIRFDAVLFSHKLIPHHIKDAWRL